MPRRPWRVQKTSPDPSPTTVTTTAETVVATLTGVATDSADADVVLEGSVSLTTGAEGATRVVSVKIERGAAAGGTQVGNTVQQAVTTASQATLGITVKDTPGEAAQSYVMTVTVAGAVANTAVSQAELTASY